MFTCFIDHHMETPVVLVWNLLVAGNRKSNPTSSHNKQNLLAHITVKSRYMVVFRQTNLDPRVNNFNTGLVYFHAFLCLLHCLLCLKARFSVTIRWLPATSLDWRFFIHVQMEKSIFVGHFYGRVRKFLSLQLPANVISSCISLAWSWVSAHLGRITVANSMAGCDDWLKPNKACPLWWLIWCGNLTGTWVPRQWSNIISECVREGVSEWDSHMSW